jgi:hypothetical protein
MEMVMDMFLHVTQHAELFAHQASLIIMGVRVGSILLGRMYYFEYWWALLWVSFLRMNNSSMLFTIMIRRFLYYNLPSGLRFLTAMEENSLTLKVPIITNLRANMGLTTNI